jgi:hypothetical protein
MALRDRLARPVATAVPAIPAVLGGFEDTMGPRVAKTARTAAIRQPNGEAPSYTQKQSRAPSETGADTGFPCAQSQSETPRTGPAHSETEAEIRALLAREMRGAGADHPDYAEALAIALADPGAALEALRSNCGRARNG